MSLDFTLLFKISVLLMQAGSRESTLSFECQLFINFSAINHNFIQKLYMAENNTHLLHAHTHLVFWTVNFLFVQTFYTFDDFKGKNKNGSLQQFFYYFFYFFSI